MIVNVQKNYIVFTAENQEESAKLSEASLLLRQAGRDIPLLAYKTLEIPLGGLTSRAADGGVCTCKKPIATTSTNNQCGNCGKPRR